MLDEINDTNIFKGTYKDNKDPYAELGVTYEIKNIKDFKKN